MNSIVYNPLEEYEGKYRASHYELTNKFFENLVKSSKINIDENRETVKQYNTYKENLADLKKNTIRGEY